MTAEDEERSSKDSPYHTPTMDEDVFDTPGVLVTDFSALLSRDVCRISFHEGGKKRSPVRFSAVIPRSSLKALEELVKRLRDAIDAESSSERKE